MEQKQIKELMAAMERTRTKKLILKKDDFELQLERGEDFPGRVASGEVIIADQHTLQASPPMVISAPTASTPAAVPVEAEDGNNSDNFNYVESPIVGTFYPAASPDSPPYVKVGDNVSEDTVVCIIEAMKVMNEIKAGISGTIESMLIEDGHPVEFGTKIFRITK